MKKVLIAYSSKTGATKKIAQAIHAYDTDWDICDMSDPLPTEAYDLIFVGGWIDKGTYNKEAREFIQSLRNKTVAFFFTLGAYPSSKHAYESLSAIQQSLEENGNCVINHFHCQGAIDPKLIDWMRGLKSDHPHAPDKYRQQRWADAANHPNQEDCHAAEGFADSTYKLYLKESEAHV